MNTYEYAVHFRQPYWPDERPDSVRWMHTARQAQTTAERYKSQGAAAWAAQRLVGEWEDAR